MKKIILAEDDPFLIDIYQEKLTDAGYEVKVVERGDRVLKTLEKEEPDLLILDIVLPRTDGWEVLRQIKENSQFSNIKVLVLSNLGEKKEVEKGLDLGADAYLIKAHYSPSEVVEKINSLL